MFLQKKNFILAARIFLILTAFSFIFGMGKDLLRNYHISQFFQNDREIVKWVMGQGFLKTEAYEEELFGDDNPSYVLSHTPDYKTTIVERLTGRLIFTFKYSPYAIMRWLPSLKVVIYDYQYDKDDPPKILASNIQSGQTVVLGGKL